MARVQVRISLGIRDPPPGCFLGIPHAHDDLPPRQRHFETECQRVTAHIAIAARLTLAVAPAPAWK